MFDKIDETKGKAIMLKSIRLVLGVFLSTSSIVYGQSTTSPCPEPSTIINGDPVAVPEIADRNAVACIDSPEALAQLIANNSRLASEAMNRLTTIGPPALPALIALLNGQEYSNLARASAAEVIQKIGPAAAAAVPALAAAIRIPDSRDLPPATSAINKDNKDDSLLREAVIKALGAVGPPAGIAGYELGLQYKRYRLESPTITAEILDALMKIGPSAHAALPFIALEGDSHAESEVIGHLASRREDVQYIIRVLESATPGREYLMETLARIGPEANEAVPALTLALRNKLPYKFDDDQNSFKLLAARALGAIGSAATESIPDILQAACESMEQDSYRPVLDGFGPDGFPVAFKEWSKILRESPPEVLRRNDELVHCKLIELAEVFRNLNVAPGEKLRDFYRAMPYDAGKVGILIGTWLDVQPAELLSLLMDLVKTGNLDYEKKGMGGLLGISVTDDKIIKSMWASTMKQLLKDKSVRTRQLAAETLGECGPNARDLIDALTEATRDPAPEVRSVALDALRRVQK